MRLAQNVSNLSIHFRRYQVNNFWASKSWEEEGRRQTHKEWNYTRKLTIAIMSKCLVCSYPVRSGQNCGILQKLSMGKVELRVHTDTSQPEARPGRPPSSSPCGGGAIAAAAAFVV